MFRVEVSLGVNRGKDFSYKTVELTARGDCSTFTVFNAAKHEQYTRGMHSFFTTAQVQIHIYGKHMYDV